MIEMPVANRTRGAAVGVGLGAALLLASQKADAAQEVAQLAAGDSRFAIIATLFLPVIGWVLFNIGGPALNQLNNAANKNKSGVVKKVASKINKRRAVTGAIVGLSAASLLAVPQADAANEVMQLAAGARLIVLHVISGLCLSSAVFSDAHCQGHSDAWAFFLVSSLCSLSAVLAVHTVLCCGSVLFALKVFHKS